MWTLGCQLLRSSAWWKKPPSPNCLRHTVCRPPLRTSTPLRQSFQQCARWNSRTFRVLCLGSVTALAFAVPAGLPNDSLTSHEKTLEEQLLELSEKEKVEDRTVQHDLLPQQKIIWTVQAIAINCVIEPIGTAWRFVTLLFIFVPVVATIPLVYVSLCISNKDDEPARITWWYCLLLWSLETAGPTFIKLGQWAASRSDVFPIELCELLSKLHSNAKAHPLYATKQIISKAFGGLCFDEIFEEFDERPLGVGAIAQVYRAKIRPDFVPPEEHRQKNFRQFFREKVDGLVKVTPGPSLPSTHVAIKVVHPNVDKIVNRDLRIMRFFALLLNSIPTLEWFSFPDEVATFSHMMRLQMDLRIEAENMAKFRSNFASRPGVTFPMPYRDYATRDMLIEEFAHGVPLDAFLENGAGNFQEEIANVGLDAFLHMLVLDNFIHSDLHPGNIMVRFVKPTNPLPLSRITLSSPFTSTESRSDQVDVTSEVRARLQPFRHDPSSWIIELSRLDAEGYRPQLVFVDAGLVTELSPTNQRNFLDLFRAIAEFDGYRAGHLMVERSRQPNSVIDRESFAIKMRRLVLNVKSQTLALGNISFGDILGEVMQMVRTHHVRMEGDFVNVVLSMMLLEGIGRTLDPEMDLLQSALPMLRAVGAGSVKSAAHQAAAKERARHKKEEDIGGLAGTLSLIKVWAALETRQLVTSSAKDVENSVKYDLLSPNI